MAVHTQLFWCGRTAGQDVVAICFHNDATQVWNNAGAFVAAHAEEYKYDQLTAYPAGESIEKQCSMGKPLRYRCATLLTA